MLLMFTPILACAMSICPIKPASAALSVGQNPPCHKSEGESKVKSGSPMFALDCMNVDLFQQDVSSDFQPSTSLHTLDYVWAHSLFDEALTLTSLDMIRGPPFYESGLSRIEPPILLTTQRFRI